MTGTVHVGEIRAREPFACGRRLVSGSNFEWAVLHRASLLLRWWVDRVRQALDTTWSPT